MPDQNYFEKASMYDMLAKYYKYLNPRMHVHYYFKHLKYIGKAVHSLRTAGAPDNSMMRPAQVRVLHASPNGPDVDIYVNGNPILKNFSYKRGSNYVSLPPGRHQVDIYPAGDMVSTVLSKRVTIASGQYYTLAAAGPIEKLRLFVFEDKPGVPENETKMRFIHLSSDAPAIDIAVKNGDVIFPNVSYKQETSYLGLSAMRVDLEARVAGTDKTALPLSGLTLKANETYTIAMVGFLNDDPGLDTVILNQ
ncbi:hypothetical protein CVD25_06780 [Bacillus canaveralius]|uniref:DUF4397 domain-containing protein n=1 Tax=Bacillus canaveralius TaxID=1403243 RepID=A0A2N5GJ08_9BACI|nr:MULTISPECIES: DUF4397 domain-containing protein [Bacillus]PLR81047.1 hypothetical protein CU635_16175 [Bacillus canaveralius]PLR82760.1 hypothetical protein CVD23_16320 [Bacillus sp. V33-4]PLR98979.1 hypothetical protein CVD25_06780 [Bacillus canaveralius]RSK45430.1 DUF4397 domain-containing protein [Bacillus canaveralius]